MFKLICFLLNKYINIMSDIELQNVLKNKLKLARKYLDNQEYFNAKLELDNLKNILYINKINDYVINSGIEVLEKLIKTQKK